jgi:hypothetical protein
MEVHVGVALETMFRPGPAEVRQGRPARGRVGECDDHALDVPGLLEADLPCWAVGQAERCDIERSHRAPLLPRLPEMRRPVAAVSKASSDCLVRMNKCFYRALSGVARRNRDERPGRETNPL